MAASSLLDVCRFNPTAGSTTDWTFSSAVTGYQSPTAANVVNGAQYSYRAESNDLTQWEIGTGTYNTSTGVLSRTTVLFNSSGGTSKINFSTVPQVAIVALKEDLLSGSGTPAIHQTAVFTSATQIEGISTGTVGQSLTSNGSGSDPSYQSGAWTLLNTLTASNSPTLSDTTHVTSSYNEYKLVFENLLPATTSTTCEFQFHSAGSFQATGYQGSLLFGAGTTTGSQSATTFIQLNVASSGQNSGLGLTGEIMFNNPSASSLHAVTGIVAQSATTASTVLTCVVGGFWNSASVVDGFQVLMSSGNIASGTIKLYGRL